MNHWLRKVNLRYTGAEIKIKEFKNDKSDKVLKIILARSLNCIHLIKILRE